MLIYQNLTISEISFINIDIWVSNCLDPDITGPQAVILLPAHPASFAHKFLFQRVPGCNSIADL